MRDKLGIVYFNIHDSSFCLVYEQNVTEFLQLTLSWNNYTFYVDNSVEEEYTRQCKLIVNYFTNNVNVFTYYR